MKPILRTFLLIAFSSLLFLNTQCDDDGCNHCLEFDGKTILVVDTDGNNLLFGEFAIYDPNTVQLIANNNQEIFFFPNEETGFIEFGIEQDYETYELILSETESDIISFETDLRPSVNCCGDVRFSTATFVNDIEVDNESLITIIKD